MEGERKQLADWLAKHHRQRDFMIHHPVAGIEDVNLLRSALLWLKRRGMIRYQSWPSNSWTGCITDLGAEEFNLDRQTDSWLWES